MTARVPSPRSWLPSLAAHPAAAPTARAGWRAADADVQALPAAISRRHALAGLCALLTGCGGGGAGSDDGAAVSPPVVPVVTPPVVPPELPRPARYIDPQNGSDAADGLTPATARLTVPTPVSGETLYFRRGTTTVFPGNFDPGVADIVCDAYAGPGDAADAPLPVWTTATPYTHVLWTGSHEKLVFRRLRFAVTETATWRPAVRIDIERPTAAAVVFEDCEFDGDDGALVGTLQAECTGLAFRRCRFNAQRALNAAWGATGCVFLTAGLGKAAFAVRGMVWENNVIRSADGPGIDIRSGAGTEDDNVATFAGKFVNASFSGNSVEGCGGHGVFLVCGFHPAVRLADAAQHYGWDGLHFENNVISNNAGGGASLGPNLVDSERATVVRGNTVHFNGHLKDTTGGLQLNGLSHALIERNTCTDNWTTAQFDGVNLFMDIISSVSDEMATTGGVGCVIRRNRCSGARGAGGASYASWLGAQSLISAHPANSSNAPSSGIRLYFARGNHVYGNLLQDNGSGIACDKSADNLIFNNTIVGCTMAYYDGVGLGSRGNRFFNNVLRGNGWDLYGLETDGWKPVRASTDVITLDAVDGTAVEMAGTLQFEAVTRGVGGRNFFVRETADTAATAGLAVVSVRSSDETLQVRVLRPFSALSFAAGALSIGTQEAYRSGFMQRNARFGATEGSVRALVAGTDDLTTDPALDGDLKPLAGSPLIAAGLSVPISALFGAPVDFNGRALGVVPTLGAVG